MNKFVKVLRYIGYVGFALLIPAAVILLLVLQSATYKHHLEKTLSASFSLDIEIGGPLEVSFLHGLQLAAHDVHMRREGMQIATVSTVSLGIDALPLLLGEIRLNAIALHDPVVAIVRHEDGSFNFTQPQPHVTLKLERISVSNANIHFTDAMTGNEYSAASCNVDLLGLTPVDTLAPGSLATVNISASLGCAEIREGSFTLGNVRLALAANNQLFTFAPVTMDLFGAQATANLRADFSAAEPHYALDYALPQFLVADSFKLLAPTRSVTGTMDFSTHLAAQGQTLPELKQTLSGHVSLQGKNLLINDSNLDEQFAKYESSQNFNLVDAGAILFAGPLGLVVTKGFDFANIFIETGVSSDIPAVSSEWNINAGVAQTQDVAMTTHENLLALKGALDFPNAQFKNLSIALLDQQGCIRVSQDIGGTFQHPEISKPNIFKALAGPVRRLLEKLKPEVPCAAFYTGSLAVQP